MQISTIHARHDGAASFTGALRRVGSQSQVNLKSAVCPSTAAPRFSRPQRVDFVGFVGFEVHCAAGMDRATAAETSINEAVA